MAGRFMARQGDVLIREVAQVPAGAKRVVRDGGRVVLAYGEVTGHAHAILDHNVKLFELTDSEVDVRFLEITNSVGADVTHEEHATVHVPAGIYEVTQPREYESTDQAPARVRD